MPRKHTWFILKSKWIGNTIFILRERQILQNPVPSVSLIKKYNFFDKDEISAREIDTLRKKSNRKIQFIWSYRQIFARNSRERIKVLETLVPGLFTEEHEIE